MECFVGILDLKKVENEFLDKKNSSPLIFRAQ